MTNPTTTRDALLLLGSAKTYCLVMWLVNHDQRYQDAASVLDDVILQLENDLLANARSNKPRS